MHSYFSHSTLLFSRDASIEEWYHKNADRNSIGERDKQLQILNVVANTLPSLLYAEKQFYVNQDCLATFLSILDAVQGLARIEVLLNDEIPAREVIQPAIEYNPDFFNKVYTDLINCEKNEVVIQDALHAINEYLDEREFIFQPILDYLIEQETPRPGTELNADLGHSRQGRGEEEPEFDDESLDLVCQWLAWKGVIRQVAAPLNLTVKSQVSVEEPAYYYDNTVGTSATREDIHTQIHNALDNLTDTLEQDRYILAAILTNNLAEDNVWEKTAVHITLILRDGTKFRKKESQLIEDGIPFRVERYTRNDYKKLLDRTLQGSRLHSILAESRVLFSKDSLFAEGNDVSFPVGDPACLQVGNRDRQSQLFNAAANLTAILAKAEKWLHLKHDIDYTFLYLKYAIRELARIEVLKTQRNTQAQGYLSSTQTQPRLFQSCFHRSHRQTQR